MDKEAVVKLLERFANEEEKKHASEIAKFTSMHLNDFERSGMSLSSKNARMRISTKGFVRLQSDDGELVINDGGVVVLDFSPEYRATVRFRYMTPEKDRYRAEIDATVLISSQLLGESGRLNYSVSCEYEGMEQNMHVYSCVYTARSRDFDLVKRFLDMLDKGGD